MKSIFRRHRGRSLQEAVALTAKENDDAVGYGYVRHLVRAGSVDESVLEDFSPDSILEYWSGREAAAAERAGNIAIRLEQI